MPAILMTRLPPTHRRVERKSHPALIESGPGFKSLKDAWANTTTIELFSIYGVDFAKERTADAQFALGDVASVALRRGGDASPTGGVGRARCGIPCRRASEPRPADPHCQGATRRQGE